MLARVVAVLPRFPTAPDGRFAVVDGTALGRLLDLDQPGASSPTELWLVLGAADPAPGPAGPAAPVTAAQARRVLASAPFDRLAVRRAAPSSRRRCAPTRSPSGARGLLAAGALLTLLVAAAALVLLVAAEAADDAAQAYAWEADGVAPATLRGALWWRAVAVVLPAVPAGVLVGVVLSRVTSRLVAVTATAVTPQPPLVPGTGLGWGLAAAAGGVAVALALAGAVALGVDARAAAGAGRGGAAVSAAVPAAAPWARPAADRRTRAPGRSSTSATRSACTRSRTARSRRCAGSRCTVAAGERVVVHGPNGSGKTTLLRVLAGEQRLSAGRAVVAGVDVGAAGPATLAAWRGRRLGWVDQFPARTLRPELYGARQRRPPAAARRCRRRTSPGTGRATCSDRLGVGAPRGPHDRDPVGR